MNVNLKRNDPRYLIGLILIVLGGLALVANLGIFGGFDNLFGVALFGAAGAIFLRVYAGRSNRLWALPIGFTLFGLAAAVLADGALSGSYFLGLMGIGFGLVYYRHRRNWWALIPGGVLLTLAVVAGIDSVAPRLDAGPVLFLGLAATFGALYMLPEGSKRWAIYPALATVVVAIMAFSFGGGWLLPVVLIGVGALLLSRQSSKSVEADISQPPVAGDPGEENAVEVEIEVEPAPAEAAAIEAEPESAGEDDEPFVADTRMADQIGGATSEQVDAELDDKN